MRRLHALGVLDRFFHGLDATALDGHRDGPVHQAPRERLRRLNGPLGNALILVSNLATS